MSVGTNWRNNDEETHSEPDIPVGWQEPKELPDEMLPVEPFCEELLPVSLRRWVADIAERLQCPADFPAVSAIIVVAGIVGRKIGIRPQRRTPWLVVPNLWGMVIGRPGLMKTPAIQEPLKVLGRFEADAKADFDATTKDHEAAVVVAKLQRQEIERQIKDALKKKRDIDELAGKLQGLEPVAPARRRYLVNDSTVEKLGELLNQNANGLTVFRDELVGLLKSLEKDGHEGARSFFLESWNGDGRFTYDRIGRGTLDIAAAILSIFGAIQPGPLGEYIRKLEAGGAGDDGLLQRFQLAVWPDCPKSWSNVDRWPDSEAKQSAIATYERLDQLEAVELSAELDEGEHVPYLRFGEAAQKRFDAWRAELESRLRSGNEHPAIESHLAKYRSLVPSLALLFHLADEPSGGPVTETALLRSLDWARYLESHARRIYGSIALAPLGAAHRLAAKIEDGSVLESFALRDVYRRGWSGLTDRKQVAAAVDVLVDHGWLRIEEVSTEGRSATVHHINPRILKNATGGH
jgi:hypothetical protein